jgi:stage IV sporulation protein FB
MVREFYKIWNFWDIPVFIHWSTVAFSGVLVLCSTFLGIQMIFLVAAVLTVMLLHEYGHAYFAERMGYKAERIDLFPMFGLCYYEAPDTQYEDAIVVWGGVVAQFALFLPAMLLRVALGTTSFGILNVLLVVFVYFNAFLMAFNLLPIWMLDGSKAWELLPIFIRTRQEMRDQKREKFGK